MARQKPPTTLDNPLVNVTDPELLKKLEAVMSDHNKPTEEIPAAVNKYPRFTFDHATPAREPGSPVLIRCPLDVLPRGGTLIRQAGRAFLVDINGEEFVVHESDDAWTME